MADLLTHLSLPLTAVLVWRRELFESPAYLALGGVAVFSDLDKFLGMPGLLHSLVTLVPIAGVVVLVEYLWRGDLKWSPVLVVLLFSHLLLDFLDGGPVPLLFPFIETGIGLQYPARLTFEQGFPRVAVQGPVVATHSTSPRPGFNTYGFVRGSGVLNVLLLATVYWVLARETSGWGVDSQSNAGGGA